MIDIPEARKDCNAYQESHIKGLLSFALDELEAARQRISELESNYSHLRYSDEINSDYEIWGGCYESDQYRERAIKTMTEIDPSVDWKKIAEEHEEARKKWLEDHQ